MILIGCTRLIQSRRIELSQWRKRQCFIHYNKSYERAFLFKKKIKLGILISATTKREKAYVHFAMFVINSEENSKFKI